MSCTESRQSATATPGSAVDLAGLNGKAQPLYVGDDAGSVTADLQVAFDAEFVERLIGAGRNLPGSGVLRTTMAWQVADGMGAFWGREW